MAKSYEPETNRIGTRHLRVGLEISARSLRVASMWLVDQPIVQGVVLPRDLLAHVAVVGQAALVESFDDPRVARGAYRRREGHSYLTMESGVFYVSVPFSQVEELRSFTIQAVNMADARLADLSVESVRAFFRDLPARLRPIYEITAADVQAHPDWPAVAGKLGLNVPAGRFEMYVDREGQFRWRLRRSDGEIMADSGEGYATREACEADLRWVRRHAGAVPVVFLTANGNGGQVPGDPAQSAG